MQSHQQVRSVNSAYWETVKKQALAVTVTATSAQHRSLCAPGTATVCLPSTYRAGTATGDIAMFWETATTIK